MNKKCGSVAQTLLFSLVPILSCPRVCTQATYKWRSQPLILGSYPAGNVLLSFGILMAGASISKVLLVLRHMGLSVMNAHTSSNMKDTFCSQQSLKRWESFHCDTWPQFDIEFAICSTFRATCRHRDNIDKK